MTTLWRTPKQILAGALPAALFLIPALIPILILAAPTPCRAVELKVSRDALERTLKQQLFSGQDGRNYIKGNPNTPCFTYAEDPKVRFVDGRIYVRTKTKAVMGKTMGKACIGVPVSFSAEVSVAPVSQGETIGFNDARVETIADHKELNFILAPFLLRTIPANMQVNAADLIRKALAAPNATPGFTVTLGRFKILSFQIEGSDLVVEADGDISVK
jgi:hypothetical protein